MAFNSYGYLLLFLPLVVAAWAIVATRGVRTRAALLIGATLVFYALAAAWALPVLLASVVGNYLVSRAILRSEGTVRHRWLTFGVVANVAALVGVKYGGFLAENLPAAVGADAFLVRIALPLGISFFTFQQIAFLVDTARGRGGAVRPLSYAAAILFFPAIISGPIVYVREFVGQLEATPARRAMPADLLIGIVLLAIGLFKKVVIADTLALWVDPLFAAAATGAGFGAAAAWGTILGYLMQLYFDFSGYSDMAIGAARMFGIRLPANFHSPLRVTSIVEWWRRWHMSLGRFVGDYIFQPLALPLTRFAAMRGVGRGAMHALGVLLPTFVAMFVIGAWHGGNWTFIVFGLLHASYMVAAETWRFVRRKRRKGRVARPWHGLLGNQATLLAVLVALVPFRAPDMATAAHLWRAMAGMGAGLGAGATTAAIPAAGWGGFALLIALALAICWLLPNSMQLLDAHEPVLDWRGWRGVSLPRIAFTWAPTIGWSVGIGLMLFVALALVARGSGSFVYFGY
ncbi:MBOAT family O-acyltransferase [Sphingomonas silueang]|uniref:MBOAT family O-acyltransferase n=1 Tax=Sphingomonas silueang TaxID=3156617 RepID=UPI0032B551A8